MYKVPYGVVERKVVEEPKPDPISEQINDIGKLAAMHERLEEINKVAEKRWEQLSHYLFDQLGGRIKTRIVKIKGSLPVPLSDDDMNLTPSKLGDKYNISRQSAYESKKRGFIRIASSFILALALSLNGCILAAINHPDAASMLTPEQIAAYRDLNVKVIFCLNVAGPPPAGSTTFMLLPLDSSYVPTFGDGCHVISPPPDGNEVTRSVRVPFNSK